MAIDNVLTGASYLSFFVSHVSMFGRPIPLTEGLIICVLNQHLGVLLRPVTQTHKMSIKSTEEYL